MLSDLTLVIYGDIPPDSYENSKINVLHVSTTDAVNRIAAFRDAVHKIQTRYAGFIDATIGDVTEDWLNSALCHIAESDNMVLGANGYSLLDCVDGHLVQSQPVSGRDLSSYEFHGGESVSGSVFDVVSIDFGLVISTTKAAKKVFQFKENVNADELEAACICTATLKSLLNFGINPHSTNVVVDEANWLALNKHYSISFDGCFPLNITSFKVWQHNLREIKAHSPALFDVLYSSSRRSSIGHVRRTNEDLVEVVRQSEVHQITDSVRFMSPTVERARTVFLGIGTGERVRLLLDQSLESQLIVSEPELPLLRSAFSCYPWGEFIREKRLRFNVPALQNAQFAEISIRESGAVILRAPLVEDFPVAWEVTGSTNLNKGFFDAVKMLVEKNYEHRSNVIKYRRPDKYTYDVTVVSPNCSIFQDLAYAFHEVGLNTRLLFTPDKVSAQNARANWDVVRNLIEQPSRLTLFRNRSLLEELGNGELIGAERFLPGTLASWWWDVPNVASMIDLSSPQKAPPALAFAKEILPVLPVGSTWVPAGARKQFTEASLDRLEQDLDVTFIGQSRVGLIEANLSAIVQALRIYAPTIAEEVVRVAQTSPSMTQIYVGLKQLDDELLLLFGTMSEGLQKFVYYLEYVWKMTVTAAFRIAAIESMRDSANPVQVFGDDNWVKCGAVKPENFHGVIEQNKLVTIYQRSKVNLNLNFMQVSSTVNPKVLDACAAGGLVVSDSRPELSLLYPTEDLRPYTFAEIGELRHVVQEVLDHSNELNELRIELANYTRESHSLFRRAEKIAELHGLLENQSKRNRSA